MVAQITVYIVRRDTIDGPEVDVFTNESLAAEWALECESTVQPENIIDRSTLDAMKQARREQCGRPYFKAEYKR